MLGFFTPGSETEKYTKHVRNSAGVVGFVAERADTARWVEVGRSDERFGRGAKLPRSLRRRVQAALV